jgi:hypothetical protein
MLISWLASFVVGRERLRERERPFQTVLAALSLVLLVYYVALESFLLPKEDWITPVLILRLQQAN